MTDLPDRQDGDGLLPCPFCGNAPQLDKGEDHVGHFSEARIWCEAHECIGPATTAAYWKDAIIQWNKRATPTRDAAEDADLRAMLADERAGWRADLHQRAADRDLERRTIDLSAESSTTPKPAPDPMWPQDAPPLPHPELLGPDGMGRVSEAELMAAMEADDRPPPDAMRDQVLSAWKIVGYDNTEKFCWSARPEQVLAALSVPVPSPDGAGEAMESYKRSWLSFLHGWFHDLSVAQMVIDVAERAKLFTPAVHRALSPSATGAAEPVAWPDHPGATVDAVAFVEANKRYPQVDCDSVTDLSFADKQADRLGAFIDGFKRAIAMRATPSVRGDRETVRNEIIRLTNELLSPDYIPETVEKFAGAILSLPVQSGADEREALAKELQSIGITNHRHGSPDGGGYSSVDITPDLQKRLIAALSRQPPHSSSD